MLDTATPAELVAYARDAQAERQHLRAGFNFRANTASEVMFHSPVQHYNGTCLTERFLQSPYAPSPSNIVSNGYYSKRSYERAMVRAEYLSALLGTLLGLPVAPIFLSKDTPDTVWTNIQSLVPVSIGENQFKKTDSKSLYPRLWKTHGSTALSQLSSLSPFWHFINEKDRHYGNLQIYLNENDSNAIQLYSIDHAHALRFDIANYRSDRNQPKLGCTGNFDSTPLIGHRGIFSIDLIEIEETVRRIQTLPDAILRGAINCIPVPFITPDQCDLCFEFLRAQREKIGETMAAAITKDVIAKPPIKLNRFNHA